MTSSSKYKVNVRNHNKCQIVELQVWSISCLKHGAWEPAFSLLTSVRKELKCYYHHTVFSFQTIRRTSKLLKGRHFLLSLRKR